ncbi:MAG: hypothetical protein J3Q66DRAFT_390957 [Benniella sp.]|nr:MAG: hypothetical protein J3Q66DRAFT_390957 [Benniella sp.]
MSHVQDPFRQWRYETPLKILKGINGITRRYLVGEGVIEEEYPGQGARDSRSWFPLLLHLLEGRALGDDHFGLANRSPLHCRKPFLISPGVTKSKLKICPAENKVGTAQQAHRFSPHHFCTSSLFPSSSQPMLDLPELLDKVFQHLDRHDLTQCVQVNKQWHALTIPHIWRDLTCVRSGDARGIAFRRMVLEDYLQGKGYEEGPSQPSALSKYGHLIRLLPDPYSLESALRTQACTQQGDEPTANDLLFHLFKHSSKAQVQSLSYGYKHLEKDKMESILAFTLPRLRHLYINEFRPLSTRSSFFKSMTPLNQCSTTLESLSVDMGILSPADEVVNVDDEATKNESIRWTSLKDLTLRYYNDNWDTGLLWSWMWKQCCQVERLHVREIDQSTPSLVQAMLDYMPNLQEITIGDRFAPRRDENPEDAMKDDLVAALLSGSPQGWKSVSVRSEATLGREAMNTLTLHFSTLEALHIDGNKDIPTRDLVQVLRSCPHLHTFTFANLYDGGSMIGGETFIDLDPDTGLFKPWRCERSLKVLIVKIALAKAHISQGREIQSQVYGRLARLTNLESLHLGDRNRKFYQYDCLEMSLKSGLDKLSGLKLLKKLSFGNMSTNIGIQEVQWMVENWPKLRAINGLDRHRRDCEVAEWLQDNGIVTR